MKFKISKLSIKTGYDKKGKPWTLYNFQNTDRMYYSCFAQAPYTDHFKDGYEFEAEVTEAPNPKDPSKPYKNIVWPKNQSTRVANTSGNQVQLNSPQLDRIEAKLDRLLANPLKDLTNMLNKVDKQINPEIPFAGDPPPTSDDEPEEFKY